MIDKFTPGPWRFVPWHIAEGDAEVRAPEGWLICCVSSDADAQLIASAPDMHAELEAMRAENTRLREALEWYAIEAMPDDPMQDLREDNGQRARAALRGGEGK